MRILHCTDSFWPRTHGIGGIQVWLTHLARRQRDEGHSVGVITWPTEGCGEHESWEGIDVFRWPLTDRELAGSPAKMGEVVRSSQRVLNSFRPDVVHSHLNRLACWIQTLGPPAAPTLLTAHVPAQHSGLPLRLQASVLKHANVVVAPSADLASSLVERYPQLQSKLKVIPYGLHQPDLPLALLKKAPFTFLCYGRLVPEKGFDVAIQALAETRRPDFRLIVAGEGSAAPQLRACAEKHGLNAQIEFRKWTHPGQIPSLIDEVAVVLVPSRWREVFGLVALEAAQRGRPVIASRVGGLPEVVVEGVTGRLVAPNDSSALARAMIEISENSSALANMGSQASTISRQRFSIGQCSEDYGFSYRLRR